LGIEKMVMMNVVAPIEELDNIAKELVMMGNVHIVNALNEINASNFTVGVQEENIDELVAMNVIQAYRSEDICRDMVAKINNLIRYLDMTPLINRAFLSEAYNLRDNIDDINRIYDEVEYLYKKTETEGELLKELLEFENHIKYLKDFDMDLDQLNSLKFFNYKIGILSKENRLRLKNNYENTSAVVLHIGSNNVGEVYLIISPKELEVETDRILRSLNFHELDMSREFSGTPKEVIRKVQKRITKVAEELKGLKAHLNELKESYQNTILKAYTYLKMEEETAKIKNETARTNMFFYLSGWIVDRERQKILKQLAKYEEHILVMFKETSEVHQYITPPTKMRNNKLLRPFETLVKMYGVPSYDELDPTVFLSITYMLLFGAMFGDVGQGLVLFMMGIFLMKKADKRIFGEILSRLGLSSTIFGFLYGSVFGFEHLIPALLINPIENINQMLVGSVVFGVMLLIVSFSYGIVNSIKQKNIKDGLFGRNGLAGLLFYLVLLVLVLNIALGIEILPSTLCYILLVLFMGLIVVREPLANLIQGHKPLYEETMSEYYIESGFDVLETLLNMLSSTISFIRVGAFALNHVGLFIAFQTMSSMLNNFAGSIIIFVIGNMIIIGLEGLIVFIQGLRLEYYEMFSKYYKGEGIEFDPVRLQ